MSVRKSIKEIRAKYDPFSISAVWDVESNEWEVAAQKHEGGDTHVLGNAQTLAIALAIAADRGVGDSWRADDK